MLREAGDWLRVPGADRNAGAVAERTGGCGAGRMPQLALARLSDAEIREIFRGFARDGCPRCIFLEQYAKAIEAASPKDFLLLRPASLVLIGKYDLAGAQHPAASGERKSA